MARFVGGVLQADRDLPTHRRLPVHRPLARFECGDVQRTADAALEAHPVQEDARIVDESGDRRPAAVLFGVALAQMSLLHHLGVELHVARLEPLDMSLQVLDVVVVGEVGAVAAAAELQLRCRLVEDALATAAVDARVVRAEICRVEQPGAVLVGVLEADPLVQIVRRWGGVSAGHSGRSYRRR